MRIYADPITVKFRKVFASLDLMSAPFEHVHVNYFKGEQKADTCVAPDYYFYEPHPSVKLNPPGTDPHEVTIEDAGPLVRQLSADKQGFELHDFKGRLDLFDDDAAVKIRFCPQVLDFVKPCVMPPRMTPMTGCAWT
jgi:hypothetical protein